MTVTVASTSVAVVAGECLCQVWVFVCAVLVSRLPPHARELRLDRLVVAGAGGLLSPGSPDVLGDFGRLVEDVVDDDDRRRIDTSKHSFQECLDGP